MVRPDKEPEGAINVASVDDATLPPGHVLTSQAGPLAVSIEGGEDELGPGFGYVAISSIGGATCGNGVCGGGESCSTCSADCGACAPVCGDGVCSEGVEDCSSCASDCGVCECTSPGTASPDDWADNVGGLRVLFLTIGGRVYLNLQLIGILLRPDGGDMTYLLAKQLIAAKLNVGLGNWSTCIEATIAAADAWLRIHPVGSNVKSGSAWESGRPLLEMLEAYNYGELCAPHRDDVHCGGD
ncbi:hypothetical protein WMF30_02885 [Sorangium sp. So ce134]